jgi:hypothetical protein
MYRKFDVTENFFSHSIFFFEELNTAQIEPPETYTCVGAQYADPVFLCTGEKGLGTV